VSLARAARALVCASIAAATPGCWAFDSYEDAVCPDEGTDLTYENFGEAFVSRHCQYCHGSFIEDRQGAPPAYVFDTLEDVRDWAPRIYDRSAGDNTSMPPGPDDPSAEDRALFEEWLACGAP
jgi:uncharacterized membrane protein